MTTVKTPIILSAGGHDGDFDGDFDTCDKCMIKGTWDE
jgi:hypothetical protein